MKLTIIIMTLFLVQVSASSRAQITIREKNTTLQKVLEVISTQSGYDFVYSNTDFRDLKPISITLNNVTVEEALRAAFSGQPLIYEVSDKTVMVKRKEEKGFIDRIVDRLNSISVRGRVVDEDYQPLQGATVSLKNGKGAVNTDANGYFFLKNVEENATIVFTYIGYEKKEIEVSGKDNLGDVILKLSSSKLDEVQVQFSGKTTRRLSTGSITTVTAEEIAKRPNDNPLLLLQGQVPNMTISPTSGVPGSAVRIQVRGQNSLGGKFTEPLIVIDGIPYINNFSPTGANPGDTYDTQIFSALSFLNPSDIESIDVLKDADATSIYGSRGGNGVILITTKKGKSGPTSINFSTSVGYSEVGKRVEMMNTQEYLTLRRKAFQNDGLIPSNNPSPGAGYVYAPDLTIWDQNKYTDWQDVLLGGKAASNNFQGSITGGNNNMRYTFGGTYNKQGYIFAGDAGSKNAGGRISLSGATTNQKFRASINASYNSSNLIAPTALMTLLRTAPNAPSIYDDRGELNWAPNPITGASTWTNPMASTLNSDQSQSGSLISSAMLNYSIIPDLNVQATFGYSRVSRDQKVLYPIAAKDPLITNRTGSAFFVNSLLTSWTFDPQVSYNKFTKFGAFNLLVGISAQSQNSDGRSLNAAGFTDDALLGNFLSAGSLSGRNIFSEYKYMAGFARLNYNFNDKYILNLSARRDGSSRFGPGNQFGNYGSIGAAYVFSNEKWIRQTLPFLSFGKIRASYGSSGNDGISDYQYLELFQPVLSPYGTPVQYQGIKPLASSGAVNSDFHWETVKKAEIGTDIGLIKDRIVLNAAYWRTRSSDQLTTVALGATAGVASIAINQPAQIQNSGWDFTVNTVNLQTKNIKWTTSANFGLQRNKILALPDDKLSFNNSAVLYYRGLNEDPIGKPFSGMVFLSKYIGVDPASGLYSFIDGNDKVTSNPFDVKANVIAITTSPEFSGGITNTFKIKSFSLSIFLQYTKQKGRSFIYDPAFSAPGLFNINQPAALLAKTFWEKAGDQADLQMATQKSSPNSINFQRAGTSDLAYDDTSFIRVKNVYISYELSENLKKKIGVKNCQFFIQGQNLWTLTDYEGFDPEVPAGFSLPQLRTFMGGISLTF